MGANLDWKYPDRKRCAVCRSYFGFLIIDGVYDSWKCSGRDPVSSSPDEWPREHYVLIPHSGGRRRPKKGFLYRNQAEDWAKRYGKEAYRCSYCLEFHIGSRKPLGAT